MPDGLSARATDDTEKIQRPVTTSKVQVVAGGADPGGLRSRSARSTGVGAPGYNLIRVASLPP